MSGSSEEPPDLGVSSARYHATIQSMRQWLVRTAIPSEVDSSSNSHDGALRPTIVVSPQLLAHRLTAPRSGLECSDFVRWPAAAVSSRAEHVRSARVVQTSICSAIAKASSTSMPRYLTVLSILVWPRRSWTARRFPVRR